MTTDYSKYRRLARALRGGDGRPNPLRIVGGTEIPDEAEPSAMPSAALPDDDAAPPRASLMIETQPAPAAIPRVDPVAVLLAALDATTDDHDRIPLLASASADVREGLSGALAYRALMAPDAALNGLDALMAALDSAADDMQRATLLSTASRELRAALADHLWWRRVPIGDAQQRYLDLIQ
jgi:hypothetical protein